MSPATFGDLAKATGGRLASGNPSSPVGGFTVDSRRVRPGEVFAAIKGERSDGHDFIAGALERGAGGALAERLPAGLPSSAAVLLVADTVKALQDAARFRRATCPARVVGVTGSNGKTTTKEMIGQVLASAGRSVFSTPGNYNSRIGLPISVWALGPEHTHAVFEMGASGKGDIAALASVARPHVGVLTNVGRAHLATFGSQEGVADAKWELISSLPADGLAVLNADDARIMARKGRSPAKVVTFGFGSGADVRAEDVRLSPDVSFTLTAGGRKVPVRLPLSGRFNVYNALAAAAVALHEGVSPEQAAQGLAAFRPPAQRMQVRRGKSGGVFVIDAYNANPDSMRASVESFAAAYPGRRRVAVLGGMLELGDAEAAEHRALGTLAAGLDLAKVYFLGPEGAWVAEGWPRDAASRLELFADKASLRDALSREPGDAVFLFKASRGVGMEDVYTPMLED